MIKQETEKLKSGKVSPWDREAMNHMVVKVVVASVGVVVGMLESGEIDLEEEGEEEVEVDEEVEEGREGEEGRERGDEDGYRMGRISSWARTVTVAQARG
jgi:hypothetical protein